MASPDNKRVAKNAIALTLRMVLVTIVGLYTSRVVLEALGFDDYGIYGVVGGIVGMASFLNTSMAGATSRFITFELGKGNDEKLKCIFSTALIIHFIIALVVVVLAETIGLWFLNNKMVIPADRMLAANVLYQFSVLSVIVGFTQVPYAADIIAHERMNIYAYFEIVNVVLKLVIIYLLLIVPGDRLIFYSALTFAVSVLTAMFYRWYCIRQFHEAHFSTHFDKRVAKEMLTFSGYDLYGNMCVVVKSHGQPIILNLFFGVVANAAASIAATVTGYISGLTTAISQAFRPQIIKQYASGNLENMVVTMRRSVQFTLLSYSLIAIPFVIETPRIIYLWLGQIPPYSVPFLRIVIAISGISIINATSNAAIHATGNIKWISFFSGTFFLMCPVFTYLIFRFLDGPVVSGYLVNSAVITIVAISSFFIVKRQIPGFRIAPYTMPIIKSLAVIAVSAFIVWYLSRFLIVMPSYEDVCDFWVSLLICVTVFVECAIILIPLSLFLAFSKGDRTVIINKCKNQLHKLFSKNG